MKIKANDAYKRFLKALQSELEAAHDTFADVSTQGSVVDAKELEHALNSLRDAVRGEVQELLHITYSDN